MTPQAGLFLSSVAFVGLHFLLSHPLRGPAVGKLGEKGFQGIYSLLTLITFGLMIYFYRIIGREPQFWNFGDWEAYCFLFPRSMNRYAFRDWLWARRGKLPDFHEGFHWIDRPTFQQAIRYWTLQQGCSTAAKGG